MISPPMKFLSLLSHSDSLVAFLSYLNILKQGLPCQLSFVQCKGLL